MALIKSSLNEVPPDAVVLSENEAFVYQSKIIRNWKKRSDVWAFEYGKFILGAFSGLSGMYMNSHYRMKVKLFSHGRIASYISAFGVPTSLSIIFHSEFVLPSVVLQNTCPVCLELRASAFQSLTGSIIPVFMGTFASFSIGVRTGRDVPYITKEPYETYKYWLSKTRPIGNILFAIFVGQALLGATVTYLESESVRRVNEKMLEIEGIIEKSMIEKQFEYTKT